MSAQEQSLMGKTIAVLMTDGVEQIEFTSPRDFLLRQGARIELISPKGAGAQVQGMNHDVKGDQFKVDKAVGDADAAAYDGLLLPGGVANPDTLRMNDRAIEIIEEFADDEKLIAAICHAPWLLIEADVVDGVRMTSWPSVRTDLANAGADVVDEAVVRDGPFITSRNPDDIPAFNAAILEALQEALEEA